MDSNKTKGANLQRMKQITKALMKYIKFLVHKGLIRLFDVKLVYLESGINCLTNRKRRYPWAWKPVGHRH